MLKQSCEYDLFLAGIFEESVREKEIHHWPFSPLPIWWRWRLSLPDILTLDEILTVKFRSDRGSLADSGLLDIVVCLANERGARSWLGQAGMPVMNSTETRKM